MADRLPPEDAALPRAVSGTPPADPVASSRAPTLSLVVPAYNEAENLPDLDAEIRRAMDPERLPYELIYVDDGSEDDSFAVMKRLRDARPETTRTLRLRRNFGQTAAMAAGFDAARGDVVVPMDADLQNDPADVAGLVEKLFAEDLDVVSGWRVDRRDAFLTRTLPSRIANALISRITGVALHDYGCTLKAYRREAIRGVRLYGEMHRFLPALASWSGARLGEMPVNHRPRRRGRTKYGLDRTLRVLLDLITVKFLLGYSTKPMQIFGRWAFLLFALGGASGMVMLLRKFLPPYEDITGTPWMYLSIFFGLGGLQFIGLGLLGEINVRTYHETQNKPIYSLRDDDGGGEDGN